MRNFFRWSVLVGGALTLVCSTVGRADEGQKLPQGLDPEAMQQMMAEAAKVGPEHEVLKHAVGKWKTETTLYCPTLQKPERSEGTAVFKLLLGGRFLEEHFNGTVQGKPYRGMGLVGYDNVKKKYTGVWLDTMSTAIMHTEGTFDEDTNTMTEIGEMDSPIGPLRMKMVTKPVDENKFIFTMYMLQPDGGESKTMEIVYTRQQ